MKQTKRTTALLTLVFFLLSAGTALACSWAAYNRGTASVVARTMDWYEADSAVVKGHGRGILVRAADTPNALEYKAKYASIQVHSFSDAVIEGMNEKGLQCSTLFLDGSELPAVQPDRKDVSIASFVDYVVSNFATVQEVVDDLPKINIVPFVLRGVPGPGGQDLSYNPQNSPFHFAIADVTGDKLVVEFVEGKMKLYHGKQYDAMTNEPEYSVHLYLESAGYRADGSILPADRRARAHDYLRDMQERGVSSQPRALMAMRGLLATVNAGTEQIDQIENEVYPTIWSVLADQLKPAYYLSRYDTWETEYYDFTMFKPEQAKVVELGRTVKPPVIK